MSTNDSGATWLSLLEEKTHEFKESFGPGYSTDGRLTNGRDFRAEFEEFCSNQKEYRASKLEAKLIPSFSHITRLARAVGQAITDLQHLPSNDNLESLIWRISFALIETGCIAGAELGTIVGLIADLAKSVPNFSTSVDPFVLQFPDDKRVQKPLQETYSLFVDSHLFIINHLRRKDAARWADVTNHITETVKKLEGARGRYNIMVGQAIEDKERHKAASEQPDFLHDSSTASREVVARFVTTRHLGNGSYGEVDEVRELSTKMLYARKRIRLEADRPSTVIEEEVKNEVAVMQKLRHQHIATVLFYLQDEDAYSIFMLPVAEYDLRYFLSQCVKREYPPSLTKQIYSWFGCLLDALAHAHKLEIKHQDIKPSNILLKNGQAYLTDFGLAKDFAETHASTSRGDRVRGTRVYRAPEVQPNKGRGRKADVFALGCVFSEMLTVAVGKSVEVYRCARERAGSSAFRDCLPTVEKWMDSFEKSKLNDLLVYEIWKMIDKNKDKRHDARKALNNLKPEAALFCMETF